MSESLQDKLDVYVSRLRVTYRRYLDLVTPHTLYRWVAFYVLITLFMLRIIYAEGWYIVCYTYAIYLLNMFLQFLTPKFDPSLEQEMRDESTEEGMSGMTENDEEFRPFIRRLPEFKFWFKATASTSIALVSSFIPLLDIPVFWPILLMYFIVLFSLTMRRQIQHMLKYRYLPFDIGKAKYGSK
ncbi:unnamed protein product [Kuraishia capsulata CBS 1993]|uniref:Protein RER1 n=1 Tax=Kuraishia capsulata CBS 1993 TaxID=1382522 RepID=W6MRS6_9ASCO|nr:uncharacterized protein KUCA_T00003927001 [Kuraishia capsulata CBS 1993]CDK27947.1 unnamed protein product [Kuraishia capsulata CBS 1993]